MQKVYFIPGLGADRRVFSFLDLSFCEPVFIDWIPVEPGETMLTYAKRLRSLIPDEHPIVAGISFGGMLAAEMARHEPGMKAILISSNAMRNELSWRLRVFRYLPFYKLLPGVLLKNMQRLYTFSFGVKGKQQKQILYDIIRDTDMDFVKWAMGAILHWDNPVCPSNVVKIHGTGDRVLRYHRIVSPEYTIRGGGHVMVMDRAIEVGEILRRIVDSGGDPGS